MRTSRLGRTRVEVSAVGLGGAPIGNLYAAVDDDTAAAVVAAAWDAGIRYFDTAPHYGLGLSEQRLGAALGRRPREQYTVSTKVGRLLVPNPAPTGSDLATGGFDVCDRLTRRRDYTRDGVLRSLDASLARLGLDRIDVVHVHDPEEHLGTALAEAIPALVELRDQGVIGAVGAGMNLVDPLRRIVAASDVDAVMIAGRWTLVDRSALPLLDECAQRGVSVIAAAPFNSGLLARARPADDARFDYRPVPASTLDRARAFARVCDERGVALPHAAMQFALRHPAVACVVVGMRTPGEATTDAGWAADPVPAALWPALDVAGLS